MIVVDRAISLTQPWATLMAIDAKRNETRTWSTSFRGWLAVHASRAFPRECQALCYQRHFAEALLGEYDKPEDLPLGQILAVVEVIGARRTEHVRSAQSEREIAFGDYTSGRYAIFTRNVYRLKDPIAIKGALGIWRLPSPITFDLEEAASRA